MPIGHRTANVTAVTGEHQFDSDASEPAQTDPATHSVSGLRGLTWRYVYETLPVRLDDLARCVQLHADLTGDDHLGQTAARTAVMRDWESRLAEQRTAAGSVRVRQAQLWARRTVQQARAFQARRPRQAGAVDFARALCAAVRQAADHERAGTPMPAAALLVAAVADPVILQPGPDPLQGAIGIIDLSTADDEPAEVEDDDTRPVSDDRPAGPAPLSAAARLAAIEHVLALIASTVEQIDRVLSLAGLVDPDPNRAARPDSISGTSLAPDTVLAIAVEVQRLRAANHARHHEDLIRVMTTSTPPETASE